MATHFTEDELVLHYYGEAEAPNTVDEHLAGCATCDATYRDIGATLAMVAAPEAPARGDQYGLAVWLRVRGQLPERRRRWWRVSSEWFRMERLTLAGAAAAVVLAAFAAGRFWPAAPPPATQAPATDAVARNAAETGRRILLTSVADHLDRSERVLTDIMNGADPRDISA